MTGKVGILGVAAAAAALSGCFAANANDRDVSQARVERGRYLVEAMGCSDCHTPKKPGGAPDQEPEIDRARLLAGHPEGSEIAPVPPLSGGWGAVAMWDQTAWAGPWGISFAANLTPDQNTGIGIWTEDMFVSALRTGRHMGVSRPILPPMPWPAFRHLNDEDLKSIFAYLRSVPPVHNRVPDPVPPAVTTN